MNTVCVPLRLDTPERSANWQRTCSQWKGWEILTADSDGEDFGRSQAVNRAVAMAGDWDVLVIADCDLLLEGVYQAALALARARETRGYVACYDTFYYLDAETSERVREGLTPNPRDAYWSYRGLWIGIFAIHREPWEAVAKVQGSPGAFDEAITSWGGEDGRFLGRLEDEGTQKDRVPGAVYHLDHPKVPSNWTS